MSDSTTNADSDGRACEYCGKFFESEASVPYHVGKAHPDELPWNDKERVEELYWDKGRATTELAERWDTDTSTIVYAMDRHGISRRTHGKTKRLLARREPAPFKTDEHGYEKWEVAMDGEHLTARVHRLAAVAWFGLDAVKDMDVHHKIPIPWLTAEWNLDVMTRRDHISHHHPKALDWKDVLAAREMYRNTDRTQVELAGVFGVHKSTISNAINGTRTYNHTPESECIVRSAVRGEHR